MDISGYKYVRFPSVLGTSLVGAIVTDANSAIIQNILIETLDAKFVNGMYVIIAVPENAQTLQFSIHNNAEFDCVVLSNSDKVEDMEPDWVKHKACLTGMFEAINIGSKLYSAANGVAGINNLTQPDFSNYAQARNLQFSRLGNAQGRGKTFSTLNMEEGMPKTNAVMGKIRLQEL